MAYNKENLELEAVNELLAAVGEDPLGGLELMPPSGNTALSVLRRTSRNIQTEGFWFNTEDELELTPDTDGRITIPESYLRVDGVTANVVDRRPHLYNRDDRTHIFIAPVACRVVHFLDWQDLPHVARWFITASATEVFVDGFPGAQGVTEARNRNLMRATVAFRDAEAEQGGYNLLQNTSILSLLRRT